MNAATRHTARACQRRRAQRTAAGALAGPVGDPVGDPVGTDRSMSGAVTVQTPAEPRPRAGHSADFCDKVVM
ncbi:hypothetical protein GCM10022416_62920 [Actinomadura keratinilytica]|uniref:Uncharacterized protein n=1 Tax=Actinomadura keratinilytica TaxID=547461 RepID=A0ABP6ULW5_9ACTN